MLAERGLTNNCAVGISDVSLAMMRSASRTRRRILLRATADLSRRVDANVPTYNPGRPGCNFGGPGTQLTLNVLPFQERPLRRT